MKKIVVTLFVVLIFLSCHCVKPISVNGVSIPGIIPFSKFKGDTAAYLQTNIDNRRAYYIGEKVNVLLNDVELPVKSFTCYPLFYKCQGRSKIGIVELHFYTEEKYEEIKDSKNFIPQFTIQLAPPYLDEDTFKMVLENNNNKCWSPEMEKVIRKQNMAEVRYFNEGHFEQDGYDGKRALTIIQTKQLKSVFSKWSKLSIPRTDIELHSFDSLTRIGYEVYEELLSDSSFFGINHLKLPEKYILLPNKLKVGFIDSYKLRFGKLDPIYTNLVEYEIKNFRPKTLFPTKQLIYLSEDRILQLIDLNNKFNLTGLFNMELRYNDGNYHFVDSTVLGLRWLESCPNIIEIIHVKNSNEYLISYRIGNSTTQLQVKKINNKWTKIKKLDFGMTNMTS